MTLLQPPTAVLDIARRLEAAGYEAWCVGGAVRDALLGHAGLDWDFATSATPDQVRSVFGSRKTVPVGIEFGTVGVLDRDGRMHEVTTFRRDVQTDGRHAVVEFGASLEDDLARRDFTINAIAYSPSRDELRDPFDGRGDLRRRLVQAVGDPQERMREDRLRALRAIRFAARLEFTIAPATRQAIVDSAPHLGRLSRERVKQELDKTMEQVRRPAAALGLWLETGALPALIPQLAGVTPRDFHILDRLSLPGMPRRPQRRATRLAGLLLSLPPEQRARVLGDLRASRQETQWVASVTRAFDRIWGKLREAIAAGSVSDRELRQMVAAAGRLFVPPVMRLVAAQCAVEAEASGRAEAVAAVTVPSLYRRMLTIAFRDPVEVRDLAVDGDDLRRAGIPTGPDLGRILSALLQSVLEDPARNRTDWLLQEAMRVHDAMSGA